MEYYRKGSHSVYDVKIHIVWITKYRKPVLFGDIAVRLRDLTREICKSLDVEILKGHVFKDHVHLFLSIPPHLSISKLVGRIKGKTSRKLLSESRRLSKQLWARNYFAASSGNVTDEVIMQYIAMQDLKERARDDDFTISQLIQSCPTGVFGLKPPPSRGCNSL